MKTTGQSEQLRAALAQEEQNPDSAEEQAASLPEEGQEQVAEEQIESQEQFATNLTHRHRVTVRGVASQPQKQHTYIIAGTVPHQMTGDTTPVALCVDESVSISRQSGEQVSIEMLQEMREGAVIIAEGKKSKYGVIRATRVVI